MRLAIVVLLLVVPFLVSASDADWEAYKTKFNKVYTRKYEETLRKGIWEERMRNIVKHNEEAANGLHTYTLGENQFSDLTWDEFAEQYLTKISPVANKVADYYEPSGKAVPTKVDLRTRGVVTPIKDQGSCGSCWAFASVVALEGAWATKYNTLYTLSEQQLVDCASDKYGNKGCQGGWMNPTFEYVRDNAGIQEGKTYPYTGRDDPCRHDATKNVVSVRSTAPFKDVPVKNYNAMKEVLNDGTPVTVAVYADNDFMSYKSGIYSKIFNYNVFNCLFSSQCYNHAITVIGYDYESTTPVFIAKNSWSTKWGEDGYMRLRGDQDSAGFASKASYPQIA